jgi:hypothetical protein
MRTGLQTENVHLIGHFNVKQNIHSLGVVEMTVAIHATFDTPRDKLIWDVSHQCYPHKILTGRRDQMLSIRQKDGLSGFTKRSSPPTTRSAPRILLQVFPPRSASPWPASSAAIATPAMATRLP